MKLGEEVLKILNKVYEPDRMIETTFKRYDLAFKTDEAGRPILLFMGQRDESGQIKGERYARRLKLGPDGEIIKDHWENKGKAS
ncbi:hypothetical protein KHS38_03805 [Mucilaginibacter sp. Bleaf8]|uniref:hypothetical protein n=1 Tax=Mucilaginibacter sp. Bleaf8 TaxID=2834430 RepID=UPI001BCF384F|nr:hypothetical protein [Mucilaginibacter sp. Bleaf8]MBS7563521.1 hypothetical protein [Mucilaginibacter sp. Bleaf8]